MMERGGSAAFVATNDARGAIHANTEQPDDIGCGAGEEGALHGLELRGAAFFCYPFKAVLIPFRSKPTAKRNHHNWR
ncbi:hypothetical protein [Burkholderia stabilis]|uniref:hypothetical protein n=1 Tax=Burkholderia stabilis TaxID=95485 RepID=UPI001F4A56A1|nr:hypothetical protein [Burkholderia stabilis]